MVDLLLYAGETNPNDIKLRPTQAALSTAVIVNNANTSVIDLGSGVYTVEKTGGSAASYDASAVSSTGMAGNFVLRIKNLSGLTNYITGVNSDPLTDDSYSSIDRGWLRVGDNFGTVFNIYESSISVAGPFSESAYSWIWRSGTSLGYGRGATLAIAQSSPDRTVTDSSTLYFDSSLTDTGDKFEVLFYATADVVAALSGQAVVVAQGSIAAALDLALSGQETVAASGSIVAAPSFALTGQSVTASLGTLTPAFSFTLSGQSLTAAQGSTTPGVALTLSGQNVSAAQGSVAPTASIAITGQSVAIAQGSIAPSFSVALSGQSATVSGGSLLAGAGVALTGNEVTAALGSLAPTFDAALSGQSLIAGQGTVAPGLSRALSGAGMALSQGAVVNGSSIELTGIAAFIAQGSISARALSEEILFWQPGPLIGRRRSVSRSR